jgi:hypothetical protein
MEVVVVVSGCGKVKFLIALMTAALPLNLFGIPLSLSAF